MFIYVAEEFVRYLWRRDIVILMSGCAFFKSGTLETILIFLRIVLRLEKLN